MCTVITAALSVDIDSGALLGFRIFPAVIGPVFPINIEMADEIISGVGVDDFDMHGSEKSTRVGVSDAHVRDLLRAQRLMSKVIAANPWVDNHFSLGSSREYKLNKRTGAYSQSAVEKTPGNRMINALLTLFSNSTCEYCLAKGLDVPVAWENRDRTQTSVVRRFGTQPLRNWLSQLQQKQIRAAMKMEIPMDRKECAMSVSHHNSKRKQFSGLQGRGREQMNFESLEAYCVAVSADGGGDVVLNGEGLGRGGAVWLPEFKVEGSVTKQFIEKGEKVNVRVVKLVPETKSIMLELIK